MVKGLLLFNKAQFYIKAKLAIKWCLTKAEVATTLNTAQSVDMVKEGLAAATTSLTEEEEDLLDQVDKKFFRTMVRVELVVQKV